MTEPSTQVRVIAVADTGAVLATGAAALLDAARERLPDLAHALVLLPNLYAAAEFKQHLLRSSQRPALILPRFATWADLAGPAVAVGSEAASGITDDDAQRIAWLYGALRDRRWFDDASRWGICRELGALFDELATHSISLPANLDEFREQLRAAYRSANSRGIEFEARLVSELWFALENAGPASPAARRKLLLAQRAAAAAGPLLAVMCEQPTREQEAFFSAWAAAQASTVIRFAPTNAAAGTRSGFLGAAWPAEIPGEKNVGVLPARASLRDRAAGLRTDYATSPVAGRVSLYGAIDAEQEARSAALEIRAWLAQAGGTADERAAVSVGVVVQDRLVARRLRALLERDAILVRDEAGWKLSTTSAATVVWRWLDAVADGFYFRDVLDLLKSPFAFFDIETELRRARVHEIEQIIRRDNIVEGLQALADAVARNGGDAGLIALLERLRLGERALMRGVPGSSAAQRMPLGAWFARLDESLRITGITAGLEQDAAGRQLLALLQDRAAAVADERQAFAFHEWRAWLNGEFEATTFRDAGIDSPVVFTQLGSTRLRRFDKVLVLGADFARLAATPPATRFFNQRVRASLGLPAAGAAYEVLRQDLIGLCALAGEVRFSWQAYRRGEPNPPAALVDLLRAVHLQAYGDDLAAPIKVSGAPLQNSLPALVATDLEELPMPERGGAPRPRAADLVPGRVSASSHASLIACPYQFYARHMLRLNESDEVEEQVAKRDFGDAVHRVLKSFHEQVPVVSEVAEDESRKILDALGDREFARLLARNPLAAGFHAEWRAMTSAYVQWQRAREGDGWRFHAAEVRSEFCLDLSDGAKLVITGRLDRIDSDGSGARAVLDYKTRKAATLRKEVAAPGEDVQLATYALLLDGGSGQAPVAAGYVALERDAVSLVEHPDDPAEMAARAALRLDAMISAMRAGAELPAQGIAAVCQWCEMRGLCRRDYWDAK